MTARLSLKPGSEVVWRGRNCKILEVVTASKVLVEVLSTKAKEVAVVSKLRPRKDAEEEGSVRVLDGLAPEDLAEAKRRFSIIKPLVRCERRSEEDVQRVVECHGVPRTTLYRWIKRYEGRRRLSDLAPTRRGRKMPKRLAPEVEAIITSVIDEQYLTKQQVTGEEVILEVHRRCRAANQTKPCAESVRARLRAIPPQLKVLKREGKKAAHDKFGAVKGNFPGADSPLSVVQIDHTLLDIIVLDEEMRLPIGRPTRCCPSGCAPMKDAVGGSSRSAATRRISPSSISSILLSTSMSRSPTGTSAGHRFHCGITVPSRPGCVAKARRPRTNRPSLTPTRRCTASPPRLPATPSAFAGNWPRSANRTNTVPN